MGNIAKLILISMCLGQSAFAHSALYCRSRDSSIFSFLSFDGNGMALVYGTLRVGQDTRPLDFSGSMPLRWQSIPMTATFGEYQLSLALDDKTAIVSKPGVADKDLECCDPRHQLAICDGEE